MRLKTYSQLLLLAAFVATAATALRTTHADDFPKIYNSESQPGEPMSPEEAVEALRLPKGFEANLFAAEPDVQNPIAAYVDHRNRLWVAENYTYAERSQRFDLSLNDRVVVLEDTDGDGVSDKRTVFADDVKMLTGITVGRGGVWLMCPPQLLFIPDADGDLVPDGPPQVKLDGFNVARENYHNFANGLSWGPDNWMYGRCGASCPGILGLPGTTDDTRVPIQGGMWRYHPERQVVEVLTHGTTNPWGHDWNEFGDLFFINTVNGHLWHAIAGAHFERAHTIDTNPHSYKLIDMHADHWHFDTGKSWTDSRDGAANDFGGGHAHIGMKINHASTWPEQYQGKLLTVNMHGRRLNSERLLRSGSGYVGTHDKDFLLSDDTWFRGMDILACQDDSMLIIDWSDTGECHDHTGVHRTSGRVFRVQYRPSDKQKTDLDSATPEQLCALAILGDEWHSRRARILLNRSHSDADRQAVNEFAVMCLNDSSFTTSRRLRALWVLNATGYGRLPETLSELVSSDNEELRCWAVRLLSDTWPLDHGNGKRLDGPSFTDTATLQAFEALAVDEQSPRVRLALATVLQRLPHMNRSELASRLMNHASDADDHNLPLMVWYALTPLGDAADTLAALPSLATKCTWSETRQLIIRRVADQCEEHPELLEQLAAAAAKDVSFAKDFAIGCSQAFAGRRKVTQPQNWAVIRQLLSPEDTEANQAAENLSILFGDGRKINELVALARDGKQPLAKRVAAVQTLVESRADGIKQLCMDLLNTRFLNTVAARGLASLDDPKIGDAIVKAYRRFHPSERSQVVSVLSSRPEWAQALLNAVSTGAIDRSEISAFQARQIASHEDAETDDLLLKVWGQVRASSADKKAMADKLRGLLTASRLAAADKSKGRKIFAKSCAVCHRLYGQGGALGPDLTGAQRSNMDFLLDNIVDPSAVVTAQYRATKVMLDDGRVLSGLLTNETDRSITLATQEQTYTIPVDEIEEKRLSSNSTMPDGILSQLSEGEIIDLFAYLQSTQQVELAP